MKISFMLNTFNSLKDAMVDALKTPDWWVYATLVASFNELKVFNINEFFI